MLTKNTKVVFVNPEKEYMKHLYGHMGITTGDEQQGFVLVNFGEPHGSIELDINDLDVYDGEETSNGNYR